MPPPGRPLRWMATQLPHGSGQNPAFCTIGSWQGHRTRRSCWVKLLSTWFWPGCFGACTWRARGLGGWRHDILVNGGLTVQVKANKTGPKGGWFVGQAEPRPSCFYALFDFTTMDEPVVYVLQSDAVQAAIRAEHKAVLLRNPKASQGFGNPQDPRSLGTCRATGRV